MPKGTDPTRRLASLVSELREEREAHVSALARIDAVFEQLGIAPTAPKRLGRPPRAAAVVPLASPGGRRRPRKFKMTGNESILAFVRNAGKKGATTGEIVRHWKSEGRSGDGYTALGELVKAKKLKREPLKGQRGSRYMLP